MLIGAIAVAGTFAYAADTPAKKPIIMQQKMSDRFKGLAKKHQTIKQQNKKRNKLVKKRLIQLRGMKK